MDQKTTLSDNDESYTPLQYSIRTYSADFTLQVLCDKINDGEIIIPPFQRKNVWTITQASRLIESFLMDCQYLKFISIWIKMKNY